MFKILYIANVGLVDSVNFYKTALEAAKAVGWEFHLAYNCVDRESSNIPVLEEQQGLSLHQIDFIRNPLHHGNLKAYFQLVRLMKKERFDIVHCNTPIGGLAGRIAAKQCGIKKVIYQVHGFHFYKGAPLLNWSLYYPMEKLLAHWTDALITINKEDYERAKRKMHLRHNGKIYYVPGVGIDLSAFTNEQTARRSLRDELRVTDKQIMLISAGDLIDRKNYEVAIRAIQRTGDQTIRYFICGTGPLEEKLRALAHELGVEEQVAFLGRRSDIRRLMQAADVFLYTTKQEGLSRSLMEAMASGLPCIVSNIRGNVDLVKNGVGGYTCDPNSADEFTQAIKNVNNDAELRNKMALANLDRIRTFDIRSVNQNAISAYEEEINEWGKVQLNEFYPIRIRKRMELGIDPHSFVLITAGRLDSNKNVGTIVHALSMIHENVPEFLICGSGAEETSLKTLAENLGVAEHIHFLGMRNDMPELMQASDCFVMSSLREGLSRVIMEAMASSLPCVVSKIRGNTDLIEKGVGGFLYNPKDAGGFAHAIMKITTDAELRATISASNAKSVERYSTEVVTAAIEQVYKTELLSSTESTKN